MDVITAIQTMRSVRQFTEQPVDEDVIRQVLTAGQRAQSSKNTQPWQFVVVRDRATLRQLAECGQYAGHLAGAAFAVALVTSEANGFDLGQAAAFMQLAAHDLGLGACLAAMWEPDKAKAILGIPADQHFQIAISFGYPAAPAKSSGKGRKSLGDLVRWERW